MPSRAGFGGGSKAAAAAEEDRAAEWEMTPGGMVVQKRGDGESGPPPAVVPTIRIKVKHGAIYHEIYVSSQATFGEVKKLLSARVGMHPLDQKLLYKDKERDSAAFLDFAGVKDRSKLVLEEDPTAKAKRLLETRRAEKMEKAAKSISDISLTVDKLASKVSALEEIVNRGGRVAEDDVIMLIELLMGELIKLDGIVADGDVKLQRRMQVRRVQKYVEKLDMIMIKIKNSMPKSNRQANKQKPQPQFQNYQQPQQQQKREMQQAQRRSQHQQQTQPQRPVVTTNWETFDGLFMPSTSTAALTMTTTASAHPTRHDWELF